MHSGQATYKYDRRNSKFESRPESTYCEIVTMAVTLFLFSKDFLQTASGIPLIIGKVQALRDLQ
jgi:hypothetical protein